MSFNIRVRGIVSQAVIGLSVLCLAYTMPAQAVDYPTRTVRLLVGWGPGDFPDVVGRLVAAKLSEKWGQAVVVENRMGANGTIASDIVAHAPPDGYTLVVITPNHTNTSNWLKLNYDPIKSFAPVAELAAQPDVIFASKSFPVNTIPELLALAKSKPGEINFGSTGPGSPSYLAMAVLLQKAGVKMASIQYKSSSAALTAMIGGEIPVSVTAGNVGLGQLKAGEIKALAVSSLNPSAAFPGVPTIAASANLPGFDINSWTGVLAPAGTPKAIVDKLNADIGEVMKLPDIQRAMEARGLTVTSDTPEHFGALIAREISLWNTLLSDDTGTKK